MSDLWADPPGEEFCILCAIFNFVLADIIETSFYFYSQSVHLSFRHLLFHCLFQGNKKPCLHGVSRVGKILFQFFTCLPPDYPKCFRGYTRDAMWIV
jgi:hypothetical protein